MKFTKNQIDCLLHRIELFHDDSTEYTEMFKHNSVDIERAAQALIKHIKAGTMAEVALDSFMVELLADAIEGSTWAGATSAADNEQQAFVGAVRTLESLARKLKPVVGRDLQIPMY